jgi:2-isopropylmalate synthase
LRPDRHPAAEAAGWRLARFEFRVPGEKYGWPVARVELESPEQGRVSDVASAPGELEAAFAAIGRIMRIEATVREVRLSHAPGAGRISGDEGEAVSVEVIVAAGGGEHRRAATGSDLIHCCLAAYVDALCSARREA